VSKGGGCSPEHEDPGEGGKEWDVQEGKLGERRLGKKTTNPFTDNGPVPGVKDPERSAGRGKEKEDVFLGQNKC